ncbi:MAG: GlxA family transcriptional regulator [Gammaproteobacteria bacterium]
MNDLSPEQITRRIAMLIHEDCDIVDACGPLDVFAFANLGLHEKHRHIQAPAYRVSLLAENAGPVRTFSGIPVVAENAIGEIDEEIDTLLIAGGPFFNKERDNKVLIEWIKTMAKRVRRIGSICTGAFLLAESGALDGHRATTHWGYCQLLAEEFPNVSVEPDRIYLHDDKVYTSGGVTAGIDLALYLIHEDWGHEVATGTARCMVTFPTRPGGQTQYRQFLVGDNRKNHDFHTLLEWINANPREDMSVEALAQRQCMSSRNFSRRFDQEVGMSPARYVERSRIAHAFVFLEQTRIPIESIAAKSGFGSVESMRRSFHRHLKISPQDYRVRFRSLGQGSKVTNEFDEAPRG